MASSLLDAYPLSEAYQDRLYPEEQEPLRRATPLRADTGALGRLNVLADIEMSEIGAFRAGQSAYNTGTGWYWEVDPTDGARFSVGNGNAGQPKLLWDGADLTIVGDITATTGEIGGWTIGASQLTGGDVALDSTGIIEVGSANDIAKLSSVDATYRFWVGHSDPASAPFSVTKAGVLDAVSGTVGGWTLNATFLEGTDVTLNPNGNIEVGSGNNVARLSSSDATYRLWVGHATAASAPFRVTQGGLLTVTGANVSGTVAASSGAIGGWTIAASTLTGGTVELDSDGIITAGSSNNVAIMSGEDATYRFWAGHATAGSAPFRVAQTGALTATSGSIGGWTIDGTDGITLGSGASTRGMSTGSWAFFAGSSTPSIAPFRVSTAGEVVVTNLAGTSIVADAIDTGNLNGGLLTGKSVDTPAIADGAVDTLQIANLAVSNAKIADLQASKITTGTLTSTVITLGTGGRIEDSDGSYWDSSGIYLRGSGTTADQLTAETSGATRIWNIEAFYVNSSNTKTYFFGPSAKALVLSTSTAEGAMLRNTTGTDTFLRALDSSAVMSYGTSDEAWVDSGGFWVEAGGTNRLNIDTYVEWLNASVTADSTGAWSTNRPAGSTGLRIRIDGVTYIVPFFANS